MSQTKPTVVSFNQAYFLVKHALMRKAAIMLHGSPSTGKTAIGNKVAKDCNLMPITFSLMDHVPEDISGLPDLSGEKAVFKPFDTFPIAGDKVPDGYKGWLIMLDEYPSGTQEMQAAANKIIYERLVGNKKLHPLVFVMAMGNLASDNAYVNEAPAHSVSRQIHLHVAQYIEEWRDWALGAGVDPRVILYAMSKPSTITEYDPEFVGINYTCARTMETLSKQILGESLKDRTLLPIIQGTIGEGEGIEFYNFCKLEEHLPSIDKILNDPYQCLIPEKMSHRWALVGMLTGHIKKDNAEKMFPYIMRLPVDLQYLIFKLSLRADQTLLEIPVISDWLNKNSSHFIK